MPPLFPCLPYCGQVSGQGTGGDGYHTDGGHGVHDQENSQHDHGTINDPHFVNSERNLERHEVLPASTYKLKKPDFIPDASLNRKLTQADLPSSSEIGAKDFDKIGAGAVTPSLNNSRFDDLISESSTQALETEETTQHNISSPFPEINSHSPARVRELRPGSGRISRPKRLATSGAEPGDWFGGKVVLLMLIWFMM